MSIVRRDFLRHSLTLGAASLAAGPLGELITLAADKPGAKMRLGLCTYLWGQDWDLPTLIANCAKTKVLGVELRTGHKHGVEPKLNAEKRQEVKKRFADSPVVLAGFGCNECYHHVEPAALRKAIEATKAFVRARATIAAAPA